MLEEPMVLEEQFLLEMTLLMVEEEQVLEQMELLMGLLVLDWEDTGEHSVEEGWQDTEELSEEEHWEDTEMMEEQQVGLQVGLQGTMVDRMQVFIRMFVHDSMCAGKMLIKGTRGYVLLAQRHMRVMRT